MKLPYLQVRNDCLLYYQLPDFTPARTIKPILTPAYSGKITDGSKKRIEKAIDILVQKSPTRIRYNPVTQKNFPFRLSFVTLTFSTKQKLDAPFVYTNLLKPLLRKMRKGKDFSYVWKVEFQSDLDYQGKHKEHGGQLHYHIASNLFMVWSDLRYQWNQLQRKNGLLIEYALKHGHYNPNSTDIHSVYHVQDLAAYISKYMSKKDKDKKKDYDDEQARFIKGKVWDCSKDLKLPRFSFLVTTSVKEKIEKARSEGKIKQIDLEHCTIFKTSDPLSYLTPEEFKNYLNWRDNIIIQQPMEKQKEMIPLTLNEQLEQLENEVLTLQKTYFSLLHSCQAYAKENKTTESEIKLYESKVIERELKEKCKKKIELFAEKARLSKRLSTGNLF